MAALDPQQLPRFDDLPVRPGAPPESSWGVFGDDDQVGTLNLVGPEQVLAAARLVRKGKVFRLDVPLHIPERDKNAPGRRPIKHTFKPSPPARPTGLSDGLDDFDTQVSTQWDGLKHHYHPEHKLYYNGVTRDEVMREFGGKLGIENWANRFVGRGVLIDAVRYRESQGRPINPASTDFIALEDLKATLATQRTELRAGDFLLIRTGYIRWYLQRTPAERQRIATSTPLANGIEPGRETVAWLWDNHVAAVVADNIAVEPIPWFDDRGPLHYRLIPLLGMPLGELFTFEELAADCAEDGIYECMLAAAPLHLFGGVASPGNALAIK